MSLHIPSDTLTGRPNCGVVATATALGIPYMNAHNYFAEKRSPQWRGKLTHQEVIDGIQFLGGRFRLKKLPRMTQQRFVEWHTVSGRTYVVAVSGHFVTVRDGLVADQDGTKPHDEHRTKKRRALWALMILKKGERREARRS